MTPIAEMPMFQTHLPPTGPTREEDGRRHFSGLTYGRPSGYRPLLLDLWVPATAATPPLVVWIHGGGWLFGDRRHLPETLRPNQLFDALTEAGLAVASVDYRHSREAPFPAQLHDVKAAVRYLRSYAGDLGVDSGRIGVWGESAGGHLAALVALTAHRSDLDGDIGVTGPSSAVRGCVDWYGVSDPRDVPIRGILPEQPEDVLLAGADESTRRDAAPLQHVRAGSPPFLLLHGTQDQVVPFAQSEALAHALAAAGGSARLVAVPGADHIFLGHPDIDDLVRQSVAFLTEILAADTTTD